MIPLNADDPRVIGEFRLRAQLGSGGMGRVYFGMSPSGRAVAVKVIHPHLVRDSSFIARFRREVAAAQAVNGAYTTPVVAAGPDDNPPWLATAFVPGPSLQDAVMAGGPMPELAVWKLTAGLAEALCAIHGSGLVHRDLKPGNVLLAEDGPRVIDFGVARAQGGTVLTTAGSVMGTPSYMSPEQAQGKDLGPSSDVFSLGGMAYFAATGTSPFGEASPAVLMYRIVHGQAELDALPPRLRGMISACLAKDPARRPDPARLAARIAMVIADGPAPDQPVPDNPVPDNPVPATFWPEPVAQFIRSYQDQLGVQLTAAADAAAQLPTPEFSTAQFSTAQFATAKVPVPAGQPLAGRPVTTLRPVAGAPATIPGMGRRRALAALAGATTAGLALGGWEIARAATRSGSGVLAGRKNFHLPPSGHAVWTFPANGDVNAIAVADGVVYAASMQHAVYALDAHTGKQLWRHLTLGGEDRSIAVSAGVVVVGTATGVVALAASSGQQLWTVGSQDGPLGLAAADGVAYAGMSPKTPVTGGVIALNAPSGETLWTLPLGPVADEPSGVTVAAGTVYLATSNGEILAVGAATGKPLWRKSYGNIDFFSAPTVQNGTVYVATDQGVVHAVSAAGGRALWRRSVGGLIGNVVVTPTGIAMGSTVGVTSGGVSTLAVANGKPVWHQPVPGGVFMVAAAGDTVYSGSNNGAVDAWHAASGQKKWSYPAGDAISSAIVVAGGVAYFGSNDHHLYAVAI